MIVFALSLTGAVHRMGGRHTVTLTTVQVHEQLNIALEEYDGMAAPERTESNLMAGAAGQEGAPSPPQYSFDPAVYAPAAAGSLGSTGSPTSFCAPAPGPAPSTPGFAPQPATLAATPAAAVASGPDLIDFGDEEAEAPAAHAPAAGAAADTAGGPAAVPDVNAQKEAVYDDFDNLVGASDAPAQGVDAPAGTLEGAFEGVSLQQQPQPTSASQNPFAT